MKRKTSAFFYAYAVVTSWALFGAGFMATMEVITQHYASKAPQSVAEAAKPVNLLPIKSASKSQKAVLTAKCGLGDWACELEMAGKQ